MHALAPFLCLTFSLYFVIRDCRRRRSVSAAVWVPTILLLILASRPVSVWVHGGRGFEGELGNETATSSLDQFFYLSILVASLLIATIRGIRWNRVLLANSAIILFYAYFGASVIWSGDPSGSIKRLVKDFGLLFVLGVIHSEKDPLQAMRAIYIRCALILVPLSVAAVKYFPEYSRDYSIGGRPMVTGLSMQKNSLGEVMMLLLLFLTWDYFETRRESPGRQAWWRIPWELLLVFVMCLWLLRLSESKTALLCTFVGIFLIWRGGVFASKMANRAVFVGVLSLPFLLFTSQQFSSVIAPMIEAMGRDMTFTGRTNIWQHITLNTVNPVIGAGYWNFWGGPGGVAISTAMNTIVPNAHNGYLDIYLDGGFIGLALLLLVLTVYGNRIVRKLDSTRDANRYLRFRLTMLAVLIIYNLSESTFARMGPMWFTGLLMIVDVPGSRALARVKQLIETQKGAKVAQYPGVALARSKNQPSVLNPHIGQ